MDWGQFGIVSACIFGLVPLGFLVLWLVRVNAVVAFIRAESGTVVGGPECHEMYLSRDKFLSGVWTALHKEGMRAEQQSARLRLIEQEIGLKPVERVTQVQGSVTLGGPGVFGMQDVMKAAEKQGVPVIYPKPTLAARIAALEGNS